MNNGFNTGNAPGGQQNNGYSYQTVMEMKSRNRGFAVASFILGIVSIVCCCSYYIALGSAVLAIVFAIVSRARMGYFDGLAITGLILGIIGAVFTATLIFAELFLMDDLLKWLEINYPEIFEQLESGLENGGDPNSF